LTSALPSGSRKRLAKRRLLSILWYAVAQVIFGPRRRSNQSSSPWWGSASGVRTATLSERGQLPSAPLRPSLIGMAFLFFCHPSCGSSEGGRAGPDEHKHGAQEDIGGLKKITSPNLVALSMQERGPGLFRHPMLPHACLNLLDQALSGVNTKLPQFCPNALRAPSRILPGSPHCRHPLDQSHDILG